MSALDRKLLRDLARMRGQVFTIAIVVACGVAAFVAALSTYNSLEQSQQDYYRSTRFADVFVNAKRVPLEVERRLAQIPGVSTVETRLVYDVTLDLPHVQMPVVGRFISLPNYESEPSLNRLHLRRGRFLEPGHLHEVLANEAFCDANGLKPGDWVAAILNGRRQEFQIVGVVLSPEYIFATRPGEPLPDDRRFGIMWISRKSLESAFNMEGAFNDAVFKLARGTSRAAVIAAVDRVLEPYGCLGAYGREDQISNRFVSDELRQLRITAMTIPVVFLGVAAFLLNIVLTRMVGAQREQIAALKALGYENGPIARHYLKMVLVVVAGGSLLGVAMGGYLGWLMTANYTNFFRFPKLTFQMPAWVPAVAIGIGVLAAVAGALNGVRRVIRLAPAEAMRPPVPTTYRHAIIERLGLGRWISPRTTMVVRQISGRPMRSAMTVLGIAISIPIIVLGMFWNDAFDYMVEVQFYSAERSDAMLTFVDPVSADAIYEVAHLPGVMYAERMRAVPVRLRAGQYTYRTAIVGVAPGAVLRRLLDADNRPVEVPRRGLMLTDRLAQKLHIRPGDKVEVEVLEGKRPVREVAVTALVNDLIGLSAYMDIDQVNRLAGEGDAISGAAVMLDRAHERQFYAQLKEMPRIATLTLRKESLRAFMETTAKFILVFTAILTVFAAAIAVGVVYNSARIALAERAWELASLRVLGFTRAEVSTLLLAELGFELLLALPLGIVMSRYVVRALAQSYETDLFRIPPIIEPRTLGFAVVVVLVASALSALVVRRKIDTLDLVGVLKTRE